MQQTPLGFYATSVGKKMVMGVTGFIVFGFVVAHILGNLQIFSGAEKLNNYAAFLHNLGSFLWLFRVILLASAILHVVAATQVTLQSLKARPARYRVKKNRETTYAARTMRYGGPIILLFVLYHLLHFTFGTAHHNFTDNVYNNVVVGFQVWWIALVYILAIISIGLHLYHGVWSMFQSVGLAHPEWNSVRKTLAIVFALAVTLAGVSIPIAVLTGVVKPV